VIHDSTLVDFASVDTHSTAGVAHAP
jgi:hypothetical protein